MRALAFAAALMMAAPAFAQLPQPYYDQARRDASSIVVIELRDVSPPPYTQGFGNCVVRGRVIGVLQGTRHRQGQDIRLDVPCAHRGAPTPVGAAMWQDFETLRQSPYGRAYLAGDGTLALYQYEPLTHWTDNLPTP